MGYVFDFQDAQAWQHWVEGPTVSRALDLQAWLMGDMLSPRRLDSVLSIGCGTCRHLRPFIEGGVDVTGIDPSPYMLDIARERFGRRAELRRGTAEDLPFDDNAFNHAVLFLALEFVEDPVQALSEAFRVAKDRVFIGIWNRRAPHRPRRVAHRTAPTFLEHARFFSIREIRRHVNALVGAVPTSYRTVGQFPFGAGGRALWLERRRLVQHCPFGVFAGLVVTPVPRFRVRPLDLTCAPEQRPVAG